MTLNRLVFQRVVAGFLFLCVITVLVVPLVWFASRCVTSNIQYDVLIKNGTIYDGTLREPYVADIGIKGDRIVAIGKLTGQAAKTIDAKGCIVTPGFIDVHNHYDYIFKVIDPATAPEEIKGNFAYLYQGVTTIVTGNCGVGIGDTQKWLGTVESMNCGTNVVHLAPHGEIRRAVFGDNQPDNLTPEQLESLKKRVEQEMKNGAWGMSTGLVYAPGMYATTEELIELCKVVKQYGGIYATHMRDETGTIREDGKIAVLESIGEAIEIGRQSGIPVQISHLELQVPWNGVKASQMLGLIEAARMEGIDVTADNIPYTAGMGDLSILLPNKFKDASGGISDYYKTTEGREEMKSVIEDIFVYLPPEKIIIFRYDDKPDYVWKTLKEIADIEGKSPADCYIDLVCEPGGPGAIMFAFNEQAMRDFMPNHYVFTCSDGMPCVKGLFDAHPRTYAAFTRKLKTFALDNKEKVMSLQAAIRSMTSLPAEKFGMTGRGKICGGYFADIAIIDLNTLEERATYQNPDQYSRGVVHLLVNGVLTIENGQITGQRAGKALQWAPWSMS